MFFGEYYWNWECVSFNDPYDNYCQYLNDEIERSCIEPFFPVQPACEIAINLRNSICGEPWIPPVIGPIGEGSGEEGSGASGN